MAFQYRNGALVEMTAGEVAQLDAPPPVPASVTPRQFRLAIHAGGLTAQVDAYVAGLGEAARIEWDHASIIRRDHALIAAARSALALTDQQADDLFRLAATF